MTPTAFGTLMALEPAIGVALGLLVLHQTPSVIKNLGTTLVVLAGTVAQRTGRHRQTAQSPDDQPELDITESASPMTHPVLTRGTFRETRS